MERRKFLRNSALALPALGLLPPWLAGCKKTEPFEGLTYNGRVVVIGAGISGLYAAHLLLRQGAQVTILEASDRIGGRIRPLTGFSDFTIELGAEEIHGSHTAWYDMIKRSGASFADDNTTDYFLVDNVLRTEASMAGDAHFDQVVKLSEDFSGYTGSDVTAMDYAMAKGIAQRVYHVYEAWVGNEHGTETSRLGMWGLREEDELWLAGDDNYLLRDRDLLSIVTSQFAGAVQRVVLNEPVQLVDYSSSEIVLTTGQGNVYKADKVIVTVPLAVLQQSMLGNPIIQFTPDLPDEKKEVVLHVGMGGGTKIIMRFANRFWPPDMGSLIAPGWVPEFWATGAGGRSVSNNVLTALVCGGNAEFLDTLANQEVVNHALQQLNDVFGSNVASAQLEEYHIMSWGKEPFIRGAYSYPVMGTGNAREILAKPIDDKVFFAGEHTHFKGHFATVHGAMETAVRAVNELLEGVLK